MDLLGDIGHADQLTATRAENAVLQQRVKELTARVKVLQIENESLKAEIEMYRKETALPNFSQLALGQQTSINNNQTAQSQMAFVKAGDGTYPSIPEIVLSNLHGPSNPLCCSLNADQTILSTGGADGVLSLVRWGSVYTSSAEETVRSAARYSLGTPVVCAAFSMVAKSIVAAACMDGNVYLVDSKSAAAGLQSNDNVVRLPHPHRKYVKSLAWSCHEPTLATASANGSIHIYKITPPTAFEPSMKVSFITSLHWNDPVETCLFLPNHKFTCHVRGTPFLQYFNENTFEPEKQVNLNADSSENHDYHVSFTIMDLQLSPNKQYLAAATDAHRNMILDLDGVIIRNLYGHTADGFSTPKIVWANDSYVVSNTQDQAALCVWDVASSQLVARLTLPHTQPIRAICSSGQNFIVTTSFDKQTCFWTSQHGTSGDSWMER
jgi:WD40 repeat protein